MCMHIMIALSVYAYNDRVECVCIRHGVKPFQKGLSPSPRPYQKGLSPSPCSKPFLKRA